MKKADLIKHLALLHENKEALEHEIEMYRELLAAWPEREDGLDYEELPDTEPGTPRTKSSQTMRAVRPEESGE